MYKRIKFLLVLLVTLLLFTGSAFAEEISSEKKSISEVRYSRDTSNLQIRGETIHSDYFIEYWQNRIKNQGDGWITISGSTNCNQVVDVVGIELTIQRFVDGNWIDIDSYEETEYTSNEADKFRYVSVDTGYYYRISSYHYARHGLLLDETTAISSPVYVE